VFFGSAMLDLTMGFQQILTTGLNNPDVCSICS
jgi:hypothetical protein